jgi:hypothetical protein
MLAEQSQDEPPPPRQTIDGARSRPEANQKIIVKDSDHDFQLEIPKEDTYSRLPASTITYRFATGPSKGKRAMTLKSIASS